MSGASAGRFTEWSNNDLAAQCRMQARENLDPEYGHFMAAVADRLDAHAAAPESPWRPISEAPKDGRVIWVLDQIYRKPWHYECEWNGVQWYHGFGDAWPPANPTHWMPLPLPPTQGGGNG